MIKCTYPVRGLATGPAVCLALLFSGWTGAAGAAPDLELKPIRFGNYTTVGVIKGTPGRDVTSYGGGGPVENQPFSRIAVWLTQEAAIREALLISVGVGGLFWYALPEQEGLPHTRLIKFGPGVNVASASYRFGDLANPWLNLKMGFFPHKYNPDAHNLGEYLFRSGTYPGALYTGGWSIVNSAGYDANGLLGAFSFLDNRLKLDLGLFMERDLEPNFDLTPSILASYDMGGILEVGAGIAFSHLVPLAPEKTTPKDRRSAYTSHYGAPIPLPSSQQNLPGLNDNPSTDPSVSAVRPEGDPLIGQDLPANHPTRKVLEAKGMETKYYSNAIEKNATNPYANGIPEAKLSYYTFQGQKIMARAAFRPRNLLRTDLLGPDDLTVYGEVALLGIKDYPFYYEDKTERMPILFGIKLPTFRKLDVLSLEFEYNKARFRNNVLKAFDNALPVWNLDPAEDAQEWNSLQRNTPQTPAERGLNPADPEDAVDYQKYLDEFPDKVAKFRDLTQDPHWWWSLYAKKTIVSRFSISLQAARDHFRAIDFFAAPSYEPVFHRGGLFKDWYWAFKVEFGS